MKKSSVVVGMSGGVDSSVALILLKKQGWNPVGVTLKLAHWKSPKNCLKDNVCCSPQSIAVAKSVCRKLGVKHHVIDASNMFRKIVMKYFTSQLKHARTPNPCIVCNRDLKFRILIEWAKKRGITHVATGHYARVRYNRGTKKYELLRSRDRKKDQSYGLSMLTQQQLKHTRLPLGEHSKAEVYDIATSNGFPEFKKRKQSQDLCFVSHKAYPLFLERTIGKKPGNILDESGNFLGKHNGPHFFTIGQKKGLSLPGKYYVKKINQKSNSVTVTDNVSSLTGRELILSHVSFISGEKPKQNKKLRVRAKIRYGQPLSDAILHLPTKGTKKRAIRIVFKRPQLAPAPGQFCVFYMGEVCLGCGMISRVAE